MSPTLKQKKAIVKKKKVVKKKAVAKKSVQKKKQLKKKQPLNLLNNLWIKLQNLVSMLIPWGK